MLRNPQRRRPNDMVQGKPTHRCSAAGHGETMQQNMTDPDDVTCVQLNVNFELDSAPALGHN